jgi:hypothetical protein
MGQDATTTSFPLFKYTRGVGPTPAFSGWRIYSSHGKWHFPPLLWCFPPTATFTRFPAPDCWAGTAAPAFSSQLIYSSVRDCLSPLFSTQGALLSLVRVFFFQLLVYYSVCFFSLGGSLSVHGAMLIWHRFVCGSTVCLLAHLVVCFSQVRHWHLVAREPSWFLCLTWSGDAMRRLRVLWCWSFTSSWWFFLQGVLQHLSKILL